MQVFFTTKIKCIIILHLIEREVVMVKGNGRKPKEKRYDSTFATILRELLRVEKEDKGVKLEDVAKALGVTRQSLAQYRDGNNIPDVVLLSRMADYFGVSTDYLLGRTSNKTTDANLKAVCDYTGLSDKAVENLRKMQDVHKNPFIYPFLTAQFLLENAYTEGENSVENRDSLIYKLSEYYRYNVPNSPYILHVFQSGSVRLRDVDIPPTDFERLFSSAEMPINDVLTSVFLDGIRKAAETEKPIFEQEYLGVEPEKGE